MSGATNRRRVLVAEDEALVSMLIEDELERAGYEIVGPFASCAEASHWLATETPDAAVLDHNLKDGPCTSVAAELRRRNVPFVALTGSKLADLPAVMLEAPRLMKPNSMQTLPGLLGRLIARSI